MHLRRATIADIPTLKYWDTRPHVIASSGDDGGWDWDAEIPREVPWAEMLIAEEDGRPIGFIQIIDPAEEESHYWGECEPDLRAIDIWIGEEADLGRGLGTQMMRLAIARCFAEPSVRAVVIDPMATNTRAHRFYERFGFRPIGPRMFGPDDCLVFRLDREEWRG